MTKDPKTVLFDQLAVHAYENDAVQQDYTTDRIEG